MKRGKSKARSSSVAPRSAFWQENEQAAIDKYRIETIRHAANAVFHKLGEIYVCGAGTEQGRTAMNDALSLIDVIVRSHSADQPIGPNAETSHGYAQSTKRENTQ